MPHHDNARPNIIHFNSSKHTTNVAVAVNYRHYHCKATHTHTHTRRHGVRQSQDVNVRQHPNYLSLITTVSCRPSGKRVQTTVDTQYILRSPTRRHIQRQFRLFTSKSHAVELLLLFFFLTGC